MTNKTEDTSSGETVQRHLIQMRIVVAIPFVTTFFVLGLGLVMVELHRRNLLSSGHVPTALDMQHTMSETVTAVIIAAAGALIAGVLLAFAVLRPFREFETKTRRMAAGDLTARVRMNSIGTEFGELAEAFNRMAVSLNDFFIKGCLSGTITLDREGRITSISREMTDLLDCGETDIAGRMLDEIFLGGDDNRAFRDMVAWGLERREPTAPREMVVTTRAGRDISVKASLSLLRDQQHASPGMLVTIEDISTEKRVREELRRIDRLAALDGLAAGIAHQVRNPLCSIRGFAQLVGEGAGQNETMRGVADQIIHNADRINAAINEMFLTLRPGTPDWKYDHVDETVRAAMHKNAAQEDHSPNT